MSRALQAYRQNARSGLSGRRAEAALLQQCARDLQAAVADTSVDLDRLQPAVAQNRRVWSLIAADVTEPESPLPADLKQNLVNISAFMLQESLRALVDPRPERVEALIHINKTIAEGLEAVPASDQSAPVVEPIAPSARPPELPRAAGPYGRPATAAHAGAFRSA